MPFLENVTAGRGIPRERLESRSVQHYRLFGGRSPINDLNRDLLAGIQADLAAAGIDLPVYWGNRNWDPYLTDAVQRMKDDGVTRAACFVTSAYSSLVALPPVPREPLRRRVGGRQGAPVLDKLRHYFNHPGFVEPVVDAVLAALAGLDDDVRAGAHLAFVTHSIPLSMAETAGPPGSADGGAYVAQHLDVVAAVTARIAEETGIDHPHELVYCSRSGSPQVPWLEPDVNDHLEGLAKDGVPAVVLVPVGLRLRPHGGRLRPRHRGAGHRRAARPARAPRGHRRDRPALRRDGPRPAARARRGRARRGRGPGQRRDDRPAVGPLPGRLLPEPACRPARSLRGGRRDARLRAGGRAARARRTHRSRRPVG